MPKLSEEDMQSRRRDIIDAAGRCFARKGIQATTMREIFAEVGMSAGAVYNYFRTKDDLIASGIVSSTEETADLIKAVASSEEGPRAFRDVIGFFLADLEQARADGRAKATPMVHAEVSVKPGLLQKFKEGRSKIREALTEQVGVMRPELDPVQCARLASFVYTLYEGMVASAALEEDLDVEAMAGIIDLVLTQYPAR